MLKHFIVEVDSNGNMDLSAFDTLEQASMHINDCAIAWFNDMLEDYEEADLDIHVTPSYGRVSIEAPGKEYDRVWEYRSLEI